jgi:hypothetical protein
VPGRTVPVDERFRVVLAVLQQLKLALAEQMVELRLWQKGPSTSRMSLL